VTVTHGTEARCKGHSESGIALVQDLHDDTSRIGNAVSPKSRDGFSASFEPATDSKSAHISRCYRFPWTQVMRFQSPCRHFVTNPFFANDLSNSDFVSDDIAYHPSFPQSHSVDFVPGLWHVKDGQAIPLAHSKFFDNFSVF
jgi:hypothetical protein